VNKGLPGAINVRLYTANMDDGGYMICRFNTMIIQSNHYHDNYIVINARLFYIVQMEYFI